MLGVASEGAALDEAPDDDDGAADDTDAEGALDSVEP